VGSATITSTQNWTAPAGVTAVQVECWGSGADGAANKAYGVGPTSWYAGGGGGGGAYAKKNTIAVTPGNAYLCTVPAGSSSTKTSFINNTTVSADYGLPGSQSIGPGSAGAGGAGGQNTSSTGDTVTSGTDGGGSSGNGGIGGAGASPGGGAGGFGGGVLPNDGRAGTAPGGGGGGASGGGSFSHAGGAGARGQIVITWVDITTLTPGFAALVFTKYAPSLTITPLARVPGAAVLVFTGFAPTVSINPGLSPPPAALHFTGFAPSLKNTITIPARALTFTGYAPVLTRHLVPPAPAHLVFTGYPPRVFIPPPPHRWPKVRK
jgi:hypothetical protein